MSAIALGMIIFAYLCGSISSAVLICRLIGLPDPRYQGSKNPGATNVLRIGGKKAAALAVLICDILKGMIPVWLAYLYLNTSPFYLGIIAIASCLGHIYPIFFHFKGGKGVATAFGSIVAIGWGLSSIIAGTWLLTVLLSGYSSLGAIITALLAPFYVWWFKPEFTFPVTVVSFLMLFRHHENIQRLWRGKESPIWQKMKKKREKRNKEIISLLRNKKK
ncbi:MAG: glycerol-3-phosphate 1-O-acyltransferase PlsY [Arsenophonus sp. NC-WZS1-MAG3]